MTDLLNSATASARAFVSISIDADAISPNSDGSPQQSDAVQSVIAELLSRCSQQQMPTTWAFRNPSATAARRITDSGPGHELALLSEATLAKADLSRGDVMQAVVRPLQAAAEAGQSITTLAVPYAWQPQHIDLLTKYGLTVIRTPHVFSSHTTTGIRAVCYGLWQVPVSAVLHNSRWMANFGQWRCMRRAIDQTVLQGGWCHLRIDAASIARGDAACGLRTVGRLFQYLYQLRTGGQIVLETLRGTATRLAPKRAVAAAQSILRAA
ncbi:MAG TPA: hypothetical protein VMJ32_02710 [Pirellulales bacterium]|nr:hypothetical protein [Pirellulales bacterium]